MIEQKYEIYNVHIISYLNQFNTSMILFSPRLFLSNSFLIFLEKQPSFRIKLRLPET